MFYNKLKYKKHFKFLGKNTKIYGNVILLGNKIYLGDFSTLNHGVLLNSRDMIKIGKYVRISPYVQIHTGQLNLNQNYRNRTHISKPVIIEDGVWLASGSIINPGVRIGEGSVIAAGSVVLYDVPNFELWGGVPAKKIKDLPKM
jgi:acetyltransferase-like isoleucine patch superfamily enzyme